MQEPRLTFQAFREWHSRAYRALDIEQQGDLCLLHIDSLEMNLPFPSPSLMAGALDSLRQLECALTIARLEAAGVILLRGVSAGFGEDDGEETKKAGT